MNVVKNKLGVALLGLGSYNTTQVTTAIQCSKNCELKGVITGTPVKASMWMHKHGLDKSSIYDYDNLEEIATNDEIDIVYVSVPNFKHLEFVCRAAVAKKNVICEKPLGMSRSECAEMIKVCKQNNVKLSVGYRLCYDPHIDFIKSLAEKEGITHMEGNLSFNLGTTKNWRLNSALSGGGALMDIGIYGIYSACYISSSTPEFAKAQIHTNSVFKEVEESVSFTLYFEKFEVRFDSSYSGNQNWLKVQTPKSEIILNNAFAPSGQVLHKGIDSINLPMVNQVAMHLDDFAYSLANNRSLKVSGELGLRDSIILETLYASADSGRRVRINYI